MSDPKEDRVFSIRFSLNRSQLRAAMAVMLVALSAVEVASESLTLTTYYPAPSGVYTQLIATSNSWIARDGGVLDVGTNAPQSGTTKMVVMGGNVGIGVVAPTALLEVGGNANVDSNLTVAQNVTANGGASIAGTLSVGSDATIGDPGSSASAQNLTVHGQIGAGQIAATGTASVGGNLTVGGSAATTGVDYASNFCINGTGACLNAAYSPNNPPPSGITNVSCPAALNCTVSGNTLTISLNGTLFPNTWWCQAGGNGRDECLDDVNILTGMGYSCSYYSSGGQQSYVCKWQ